MLDPHTRAVAQRRAIQLFNAWLDDDESTSPAVLALVDEFERDDMKLFDFVCSLLYTGEQLIKAAAGGRLDHYREQLLGAVLVAEATTDPAAPAGEPW